MARPPAVTKKRTKTVCAKPVRRGSQIKECGEQYLTERCPKRDQHMLPMVTGFCHSGWHEGNKIDKPTCVEYLLCPCKAPGCHDDLWQMFEMSGAERMPVNNSTWKPGETFQRVALTPTEEPVLSIPAQAAPREAPKSPAPGIVPGHEERTFAPTKDGRAAKGELELWVKKVTDIWVVERENACTPGYISNEIGRTEGIKPPSTGAITNIIRRWRDIGFGTCEEKPLRFTGYTEAGVAFGLEAMKRKAKGK